MVGVCTIFPLVHWTREEDILYTGNYSSVPHQHGVPLLSNEQLVKGTQGIYTETVVQKQCGVFRALGRQAMVGVCIIFPLVHWTNSHWLERLRDEAKAAVIARYSFDEHDCLTLTGFHSGMKSDPTVLLHQHTS